MKKTLVMAAAAVLTGSMAYPSLAEEYVFEMAPVVVTANRMNENLVDAKIGRASCRERVSSPV